MRSFFKRSNVFFSLSLLVVLHIPFVFAKARPVGHIILTPVSSNIITKDAVVVKQEKLDSAATVIYDSLRLNAIGLGKEVFAYAFRGFSYLAQEGKLNNEDMLSIVDFSKSSSKKRLFILDLKKMKIVFNTYVAHGMNSGQAFATRFSNSMESNQSSLGFYATSDTYIGKNGYSLRLEGLERGFNDNAYAREIVMHGADYVNEQLIRSRGYIGRSLGCPAVPPKLHKQIIDKIKNGSCLFIFSPDQNYITRSSILKQVSTPLLAYNR